MDGSILWHVNYIAVKMYKKKVIHQKLLPIEKNSASYLSLVLEGPQIKSHFLDMKDYVASHFNSLYKAFLHFFSSSFPEVFCCIVTIHSQTLKTIIVS